MIHLRRLLAAPRRRAVTAFVLGAAAFLGVLSPSMALAAGPTVTIDQAAGQADPTSGSSIDFTVVFSTSVSGFTKGDVLVTSAANDTLAVDVTGSGSTYTVTLTGMVHSGLVTASVAAGAVTTGSGMSSASTSQDNHVTWNAPPPPSATINQSAGQSDPTTASPITFTVVFSEPVTGFDAFDVDLSTSTAGGTLQPAVSGGPSVYTVSITGMTSSGYVVASVPATAATSIATGKSSTAATFTDHTVSYTKDTVPPTVTIDQASTQADPTSDASIQFTATFDEAVSGFTGADVVIGGTAGGTLAAVVSGGPKIYTVTVTGMATAGTVIASIPAHAASDLAGNLSLASTSGDHSVTWVVPTATQTPTPTVTPPPGAAAAPTGAPVPTPTPPATPIPKAPSFSVTPACTSKKPCATLSGGSALVLTGTCSPGAACSGTVSLSAKIAKSRHAKPKLTTLGQLGITVAAGGSQQLRIKLGSAAKKLLEQHAHVKVTLTIAVGAKPTTTSITVGLPKKKAKGQR